MRTETIILGWKLKELSAFKNSTNKKMMYDIKFSTFTLGLVVEHFGTFFLSYVQLESFSLLVRQLQVMERLQSIHRLLRVMNGLILD